MNTRQFDQMIQGLEVYLKEVITPAVHSAIRPLSVQAWQQSDPREEILSPDKAAQQAVATVQPGWRWGPKWSTCWFAFDAIPEPLPPAPDGSSIVVRFSSGTEGMAWAFEDGTWRMRQALDVNRDEIAISQKDVAQGSLRLLVEAACNHPFGVLGFAWDDVEVHRRWNSDDPGVFEQATLCSRNELAWGIRQRFAFLLDLAKQLGAGESRGVEIASELASFASMPLGDPRTREDLNRLNALVQVPPSGGSTIAIACGHAHIDTAWLWPIRETKRKCLRTFSNQLDLIAKRPEYVFAASQAQQYAWTEESAPELFERICTAVRSGQWEAIGAMWIEPDANVPSGESLVRQILHGTSYWKSKFGDKGEQKILYLPDTFGFPASLPQIMRLAGLETFITNKLWWNDVNEFPHTTFVWRGIDGSEVLAHNTPGRDYNATNTPKELRRGEASHRTLVPRPHVAGHTQLDSALWLQPFGFGDGGGGATEWMIEFATLAESCHGLPRTRLGGFNEFCDLLWDQRERLLQRGTDFAVWAGELYLEKHRGTLTTQSWIKLANRRAEDELRFAEILETALPVASDGVSEKLDASWKLLLLNQFHDILPGSSIGWVYEDARRQFDRISKTTDKLIDRGTTRWLSMLSTKGMKSPVGVFNQTSSPASGVVQLADGALVGVRDVPAIGVRVVDRDSPQGWVPVRVEETRISNGIIEVEIDEVGRISKLARVGEPPTSAWSEAELPMNQLVLYEDRPHMWDAWDIDATYTNSGQPIESDAQAIEVVMEEPLRGAIRITRTLGTSSRIEQTYMLDAGSPRIDVHTKVHWHERRRMLRALFPTGIIASEATYEIQFGCVNRPTHRNTSWDEAKFEVCAHRWMDLSMPGKGLSLLNDCKYGHSCHHDVMGLTLLRSTIHPDPEADQGEHELVYSLMPHDGDWRRAGVVQQAALLNMPLVAYALNADEDGDVQKSWCPFSVVSSGHCNMQIAAYKRSHDGKRAILRLWEAHGAAGVVQIRWQVPIAHVGGASLLEDPIESPEIVHAGDTTTINVRAFQIVTLSVTFAP